MKLTPVLEQWTRIKKEYPDALLLFRLGDFYETFYDDAKLTSKTLGIALTKRQSGVPLAGFPHHAATPYIAKLTKAGHKVAICEQLEEAKPGKLVHRDVVEVITSGTILDESLLEDKRNNYLASVVQENDRFGLALIDLSTGDFKVTELKQDELIDELKKIAPLEVIVPDNVESPQGFDITRREAYEFSYDFAFQEITEHFGVKSLDGFGCQDLKLATRAGGAVLTYIKAAKKRELTHIKPMAPYFLSDYLILDEPTRRNLELTQKIGGKEGEGTLLWTLDFTRTPMGARKLRNSVDFPLIDPVAITSRLNKVEELVDSPTLLENLRELLSKMPDLERLIARISMERANPRDLKQTQHALETLPEVCSVLGQKPIHGLDRNSLADDYRFPSFESTISLIKKAIVDTPPITIQEGGVVKKGFNQELDDIRELAMSGKRWISDFGAKERKRTGISSLKIGFNNVFGYYIEVTRANLELVPQDYIRKQTLVNAERYITEELKKQESEVLGAEERVKRIEYELFCDIRRKVGTELPQIQEAAQKIGELDFFASLAWVARKNDYVRPEITQENCIHIKGGKHPVVRQLLKEGEFVPNPTKLDNEQEIYIITGPNMAGKSTYLRQVGLIVLMAQIGSFVPVAHARIGVRDRVFTRIGASDDLARGVSTFLAEMNETANILNNATKRSLILLDEIGRGTSTFDGMSIAWATVEYILKKIGAKALFATHYHELTALNAMSSKIKNYQMSAKRYEDKIIFLRQLRPGGCDESYGIDVAKLAGIPQQVVNRAKEILGSMEKMERKAVKKRARSRQKTLFEEEEKKDIAHEVAAQIKKADPDHLAPIDALLLIKKLKSLLG